MSLTQYKRKRDFKATPEPAPKAERRHKLPLFVVQEHHASTHHFDFRLEADGVLKSWAVPKGPSTSPADKRLAIEVEDHPISYATFSGDISAGHYGAGHVEVWDHGTYEPEPPVTYKTVTAALKKGRLTFTLNGKKLQGAFSLIRTPRPARQPQWLLIKRTDQYAQESAAPEKSSRRSLRSKSSATKVLKTLPRSQVISLTHPDKVLYPEIGLTKQDVADYYRRVADVILPYLKNRPVTVERFPAGVGEKSPRFWQKNLPKEAPGWIPRISLPSEEGKPVSYALINDVNTLIYFVNQNALSFHIYMSRVGSLEKPDFVLFDLDPDDRPFKDLVRVAKTLNQILDGKGYLKTSGKRGLHVMAPWDKEAGYDAAREWAVQIAKELIDQMPSAATMERSKAKRDGRIYVDVMQNALGHHFVAPYSLRATESASASTPLEWGELKTTTNPSRYTAKTIPKRIATTGDPMSKLLDAIG